MPLLPAFEKEMTDSKIADTRNLGAGRYGGANTAAAFFNTQVHESISAQVTRAWLSAGINIAIYYADFVSDILVFMELRGADNAEAETATVARASECYTGSTPQHNAPRS